MRNRTNQCSDRITSSYYPNGNRTCGRNPNNSRTTNYSNSSKPDNNNSSGFYGDLTSRLRNLSFGSFQTLVLLWLGAKGYRDICVLKRTAARGRREIGGADFIAMSPHAPRVRVAIQLRHWNSPVQRRAVDELRGFMLRMGIRQGLVITNSTFYPKAMTVADQFFGRPMRLLSVHQLAGSMAGLGLGIERTSGGWTVSEEFFRTLERLKLASKLDPRGATCLSKSRLLDDESRALNTVCTTPPSWTDEPDLLVRLLIVIALIVQVLALVHYVGGGR